MKFLGTGDWHLDEKKPKNRSETYLDDMFEKVRCIFEIGKKEKVDAILQPGDLCNTSKLSDKFKTRWIKIFRDYAIPIYTIPGQHDMRYHSSDIENTPMGVLDAALSIEVLKIKEMEGVDIYGAGWEKDIPEIVHPNKINILLMHRMVSDMPLWPGHEYTDASKLLEGENFDLIVTGDNHKRFTYESLDGKWLINCGSLMRSSIDQKNHDPSVYVYDTKGTKNPTWFIIPHKPFEEIMNIQEAEKEKEKNKELEDFVEGLSDTNIEGLDFKKNLIDHLTKNKDVLSKGIIAIIEEVIG